MICPQWPKQLFHQRGTHTDVFYAALVPVNMSITVFPMRSSGKNPINNPIFAYALLCADLPSFLVFTGPVKESRARYISHTHKPSFSRIKFVLVTKLTSTRCKHFEGQEPSCIYR